MQLNTASEASSALVAVRHCFIFHQCKNFILKLVLKICIYENNSVSLYYKQTKKQTNDSKFF